MEIFNQNFEECALQLPLETVEMQPNENELYNSSNSHMEADLSYLRTQSNTSEAVNILNNKETQKRLSGAARKRFKWLLKQGLPVAEAKIKAMEQIPNNFKSNMRVQRENFNPKIEAPNMKVQAEESTPKLGDGKLLEQKREEKPAASTSFESTEAASSISDATPSIANAFKSERVRVGVIQANPPENLTSDQTESIQSQILEKISEIEDGPSPQFSGIAHRPGCLLITCDDVATADWLKSIVGELKPWDGAHLKVVDEADLPKSKILSGYFPKSSDDETEKILKLVRCQNPNLITSEWKVLRRRNEGTAAHVVMSLDLASFERLRSQSLKVSFKFGKVTLYNKSDAKSKGEAVQRPHKGFITLNGNKNWKPHTYNTSM